jgi:2'-5' RNA ligase
LSLFDRIVEEQEQNADGTMSCGVFLPVPYNLARQFPNKDEHDTSVPHFTILYAGDLSPEQHEALVKSAQEVAAQTSPFRVDMIGYGEFENDDGQRIPHMIGRAFRPEALGWSLGELHAALYRAAVQSGVPISHTYGPGFKGEKPSKDDFKAHATLDYIDPGQPDYEGPRPRGGWRVNELEVWGHENYRVPLGSTIEATDFPSKFAGPASSSTRTGLGTAPIEAPSVDEEPSPKPDKKRPRR